MIVSIHEIQKHNLSYLSEHICKEILGFEELR